jgi:hypothetical protein
LSSSLGIRGFGPPRKLLTPGHQGRALADVVEAALRSYIEAEAITDIESSDIAATQLALLSELPEIEEAEGGCQTPGADAQG